MDTGLLTAMLFLQLLGIQGFNPQTTTSSRWISWTTNFGPGTCVYCANEHGKIYEIYFPPQIQPPVHERCNCILDAMTAIFAGTATIDGKGGADYFVKHYSCLPNNYLSKATAKGFGWKNYKGNLRDIAPDAIIGGDVFWNDKGKLPVAPGRVWYEADINYTGGYRNTHRLIYSNDGLVFVTYDHYQTFYPIQ